MFCKSPSLKLLHIFVYSPVISIFCIQYMYYRVNLFEYIISMKSSLAQFPYMLMQLSSLDILTFDVEMIWEVDIKPP